MRIPKGWIPILSNEILGALRANDLVEFNGPDDKIRQALTDLIFEELAVEDRLNQEVREILSKYENQIDQGQVDYRKLFDMTKQKLVRERNIVL